MKKLIALDVGTTSVKVSLFQENLVLVASVINEYQLLTPSSDIVELQPEIYWKNSVAGIRSVMQQTGTDPDDVVCITCATQGETLIPIGENKQPLHNAIVWLDSRAKDEVEMISDKITALEFYSKTGLPEINAYCPISKMLWVKNHLPDIYNKTEKLLLVEDYLILQLCGVYATNPALMCSTGYFDVIENRVWEGILASFSLDKDKIPPVFPCATVVGNLLPKVAAELGLNTETVVSTGAMDQIAAAVGTGNTESGTFLESTGTCIATIATIDTPDLSKLSPVTVHCHAVPGKYLNLMISQTAGIILKWFRNEFCQDIYKEYGESAFEKMSELASIAPPLSKGLFLFPHFTGIQAPHSDDLARGVFFGAGLDTGRDCFIRSIMEGIGYILRESADMMSVSPSHVISLGGGSKSDIWCQIKADIMNTKIVVMEADESASLGAAMLGGVACGLLPDLASVTGMLPQKKSYLPNKENVAAYEKGYKRFQDLYDCFKTLFQPL